MLLNDSRNSSVRRNSGSSFCTECSLLTGMYLNETINTVLTTRFCDDNPYDEGHYRASDISQSYMAHTYLFPTLAFFHREGRAGGAP